MLYNKIESIRAKYKEFNRILGQDENEELDDYEKDHIAERIDELLAEWKKDFDVEVRLKNDIYGFLSKFENLKTDKNLLLATQTNIEPKASISMSDRQIDLKATLAEKEEIIIQYEQKIEIQHAEILNRNLISEKAT